jgi:hypothetical protein
LRPLKRSSRSNACPAAGGRWSNAPPVRRRQPSRDLRASIASSCRRRVRPVERHAQVGDAAPAEIFEKHNALRRHRPETFAIHVFHTHALLSPAPAGFFFDPLPAFPARPCTSRRWAADVALTYRCSLRRNESCAPPTASASVTTQKRNSRSRSTSPCQPMARAVAVRGNAGVVPRACRHRRLGSTRVHGQEAPRRPRHPHRLSHDGTF